MSWVCKIKGHKNQESPVRFRKSKTLRFYICSRCKRSFGKFSADGPDIPWSSELNVIWGAYLPPKIHDAKVTIFGAELNKND